MVEYGVKKLITNPTLMTNATDIIKVIDARTKQTKAFVVPAKYKTLMDKLIKEIEHQKWAKKKKALLQKQAEENDHDEEILSKIGWQEIEAYLDD